MTHENLADRRLEELLSTSTSGPWVWRKSKSCEDMGSIVSGYGTHVCHFGVDAGIDSSSGEPPGESDLALMLIARELAQEVLRLRALVDNKIGDAE